MNAEVEQLALQKNNLYRDNYRRVMKFLVFMIATAIGLSCILAYQLWSMPPAKYYATTTTGRVIPLHSLSMPVVTNAYLLQWAELAARACYNLNFIDYPKQLQAASSNFTPDGWTSLMDAMKQAGVIDSLKQNKLFIAAVVNGPAVILDEEVVHNRYTWRVQLPLLVTYTSANQQRKTTYIITMDIMRVPVIDAAKSIQINNFTATR
jgi:intracellular multiplication protein IcmL